MLKVHVYTGGKRSVERSGVGRAIEHQKDILRAEGVMVDGVRFKDADIVHINTVLPDSALAAMKARIMGKKVVYYGHSTMQDFRNSFKGSNVLAPLFRRWITFCYNRGDVVITPSEYSKFLIESYGVKAPVYAVSNGIDLGFWKADKEGRRAFRKKYKLTDEEKVVISVGHFIERKGLLEFVQLAKNMPDVTFMWFGYTNLSLVPKEIRYAIENAPENLIFPGYVNKEELREAYQGCDLFCFMSHEETEGIVVLEAMACRAPMIVRDIPVYAGWLQDGVDVYKCSDDWEFVRRCREILNGECEDLTENAYAVARSRSYDFVGERLLDAYPVENGVVDYILN